MVIVMGKNTYNNILSNITNTINVPVEIKKNKQDIGIYTLFLTFVVLVISQFLFLDKFTYIDEIFTLSNGVSLNTFTVAIFAGIITFCLTTLFLKPNVVNKILYIFSFITIGMFAINFILLKVSLNEILYLPTIIIMGMFLGLLCHSMVFMILYSLGTKQKIEVLLSSFVSLCAFIIIRYYIKDISKTFCTFVLPLITCCILIFIMSFLSKDYFKKVEMSNENIPLSSIVFFIILFAVYVINALAFYVLCKNRINIFDNINLFVFVSGILLSIIISYFIIRISKVYNVFYIFLWIVMSIITFQFLIFNNDFDRTTEIIILLLLGITLGFGFIANYMVIGVCLEDKSSLNLFRFCMMTITILLSLALGVKSLFYKIDKLVLGLSLQSFIFLFGVLLVFNLIKITFVNLKHNIQDSVSNKDETIIIETKYPNPYELLTNKEIIVFEQLLLGNTLRQIAGELHMKYDTVNFHYKNIYRKLEVNSRIELIVRYGKKIQ